MLSNLVLNSRNDKISTTYNHLSWLTGIKYDLFNKKIWENKKISWKKHFYASYQPYDNLWWMIGFVHHFQCTQCQIILIKLESKSLNVKLHILHAHRAMAIIWNLTKRSLTTDYICTTYLRQWELILLLRETQKCCIITQLQCCSSFLMECSIGE